MCGHPLQREQSPEHPLPCRLLRMSRYTAATIAAARSMSRIQSKSDISNTTSEQHGEQRSKRSGGRGGRHRHRNGGQQQGTNGQQG